MGVLTSKKLRIDQYLDYERQGEVRYEFHLGEVFAMAGGTLAHTILSSNALRLLGNALQQAGKNCLAVNSDIKIEIESSKRYVYPDAAVICGKINESDVITGAIRNPRIVVEVVSDTSGDYDRGAKMRYYLSLPTLKEYLIIEQDRVHATLYRKHEKGDLGSFHYSDGLDASIDLNSIGVSIKMTDLYQNVPIANEGEL